MTPHVDKPMAQFGALLTYSSHIYIPLVTGFQVMLWQRKIELEREMNDVLDPSVGGNVVGAMKKEIHRMQLRAGELARIQESLLLDLERSIAKRDTIALKAS